MEFIPFALIMLVTAMAWPAYLSGVLAYFIIGAAFSVFWWKLIQWFGNKRDPIQGVLCYYWLYLWPLACIAFLYGTYLDYKIRKDKKR